MILVAPAAIDRSGLLAIGVLAQRVERGCRRPRPPARLEMSGRVAGSPISPVSMTSGRCPRALDVIADIGRLGALGVERRQDRDGSLRHDPLPGLCFHFES